MKKFLTLICFIFISFLTFNGNTYALTWEKPYGIKTYIPPQHKNTLMMKHAFAEWTRKTNQKILFKYVSDPAAAQIRVRFVKKINPNFSESDRVIGVTVPLTANGKYITYSDIYIADFTLDGRTLSKDEVYTTMLHEIGHALGLNHSNERFSIMFHIADVRAEISKQDLLNLKTLYKW
ncbi:matrixin family metalloprotease [bacterium]|nr:matrixin family metalloprotease [bacterium]